MRVTVIGAGVVGLTTADALVERGHAVTVFDRHAEVGCGTSQANGGQLSYGYSDAMGNPALLARVLPALLRADPAVRIRLQAPPRFLTWGLRLLRESLPRRARANSRHLNELAERAADRMATFHQRFGPRYAHRAAGKLVLLQRPPSGEAARGLLDRAGAEAIEPGLRGWRGTYRAARWNAADEVADPQLFCRTLAADLVARGVELRTGTTVDALCCDGSGARGVRTAAGEQRADAVVVASGTAAPALLRPVGVNVPIWPVTGYSLTLPPGTTPLDVSITASAQRLVFSRLGDRVRVAGFADFNPSADQAADRIATLRATAQALAPEAAAWDDPDAGTWVGHRPATPDSRPCTGPTKVPGLFVNCGHGMLGWTLCAASAELLADALHTSA